MQSSGLQPFLEKGVGGTRFSFHGFIIHMLTLWITVAQRTWLYSKYVTGKECLEISSWRASPVAGTLGFWVVLYPCSLFVHMRNHVRTAGVSWPKTSPKPPSLISLHARWQFLEWTSSFFPSLQHWWQFSRGYETNTPAPRSFAPRFAADKPAALLIPP